jgi:SulP family sulfate permease
LKEKAANVTQQRSRGTRRRLLFRAIGPLTRGGAISDARAGFTLAAMNIPQVLGYTRIAGTPVITGLYTLLLPPVAFAALGCSNYLVVAADSATAAILAGGLSRMAPIASAHYVALAGMVALLTAGFLLLARILELGFLADFLSQTVLVGFLTGVGFQVGIAMLGEMTGIAIASNRTAQQLVEAIRGIALIQVPTFALAAAVVLMVMVLRKLAPRFPGPLLAVAGAIAASFVFDFPRHGIAVIQHFSGGLPPFGFPNVSFREIPALLAIAASCFIVIVSQSSATARAYAWRHHQELDENTDLVGLAAANAAAALSGTFVVNGSPTQTAMVEASGGSSQLAQLTTAAIVAVVLLFFTAPLQYLPRCVLGAIVFTVAIELVDLRGLLEIRGESPGEFRLALITAAVVVLAGVEDGILLAAVLSLLRHVRHSYRPHTAVLVVQDGHWRPLAAVPGAMSGAGLLIFQFGANLFYANAERFAGDIRALVEAAPTPTRFFILDAGAITSIDYTAARVVHNLLQELADRAVSFVLVHAETSLLADLRRHRLSEVIGSDHIFDTLHEALAAINRESVSPRSTPG